MLWGSRRMSCVLVTMRNAVGSFSWCLQDLITNYKLRWPLLIDGTDSCLLLGKSQWNIWVLRSGFGLLWPHGVTVAGLYSSTPIPWSSFVVLLLCCYCRATWLLGSCYFVVIVLLLSCYLVVIGLLLCCYARRPACYHFHRSPVVCVMGRHLAACLLF